MVKKADKERILIRASWVSTIGNAILAASKIIIGLLVGSMAVFGDGLDSAADVVMSIVMVITAVIVSRPPSRKYPYGYEKAQSVAAKILSFIIFYAGLQMLISTFMSIISGDVRELPGMPAIYVTIFSIAGKLLLSLYQYKQGRKINSPMLIANAKNMRNDVVISVGVLLGLFFTFILGLPILDLVTGFIVSLFIIKTAVEIFIDSTPELMSGIKDISVYQKIFDAVEKVPEASNPHRVRSSLIGGMYMIVLDIEVDGNINLDEAHRIAQQVETNIKELVDNVYDIVVHVEPKNGNHIKEKFGVNKEMVD